jgi:hypothetical protein
MKEPTKKLLNLAHRYTKVTNEYEKSVCAYINTADVMDPDIFWEMMDAFVEAIHTKLQFGYNDPTKSAVHNFVARTYRLHQGEHWNLQGWVALARFLTTYTHFRDKLSDHCWDWPNVHKSDDSYGDWMDALPLAGREVVEGILDGKIDSYNQVSKAIKLRFNDPKMHNFIQNGENYIRMTLCNKLIEWFAYVVADLTREKQ